VTASVAAVGQRVSARAPRAGADLSERDGQVLSQSTELPGELDLVRARGFDSGGEAATQCGDLVSPRARVPEAIEEVTDADEHASA
jgi:hypothetical protein